METALRKRAAHPLASLPLPQMRVLFLNVVAFGWTTSLILGSRFATVPRLLKAS